MTAELERTNGQQLALAGKPSRTSLNLPDDLSFEDWEETGRTLGDIDRAVQWWVGDWLNFGEAHYGEKYAQAADMTGREDSTLYNYAYIAREVSPEVRRPDLSWSHHRAVTGLDEIDQKVLLKEAKRAGWTKSQLEREVKDMKARRKGEEVVPEPERVPCPNCDGTGTVPPEGEK